MIKIILILFSLYLSSEPTFKDGWSEGYVEGYCFKIENCIEPLVPRAPLPDIGRDTYKDGYNLGFIKGKQKRSNN